MTRPLLYRATGIILKRNPLGESDRSISVLCDRIGKKRFIAKGVRKATSRRASHLELFSKTTFLIHRGKTNDYVSQAQAVHLWGPAYTTLGQVAAAYAACEICDRLLPEAEEQDDAYLHLDRFLTQLETVDPAQTAILLRTFIDRLLIMLGYRRDETQSASLGNAIASVERIVERKIRSVHLLSKSGMTLFT